MAGFRGVILLAGVEGVRRLLGNWSTRLIGRRPFCLIDGIIVPPDSKLCLESSNVRLETGIGGLYFLWLCLRLCWRELSIDARSILDGFRANTETKCRKRFGFVVCWQRTVDDEGSP